MTPHADTDKAAARARLADRLNAAIAHNRALGLRVVDVSGEQVVTVLDYRDVFLGDPAAGLWHTAVGISAADSSCGIAVMLALPAREGVATLDLRMDYLRPAVAHAPLYVEARCYHITRCVAFVRARLYQHDAERPTALCTAAFMRTGRASA